jgi:hypothetical protein
MVGNETANGRREQLRAHASSAVQVGKGRTTRRVGARRRADVAGRRGTAVVPENSIQGHHGSRRAAFPRLPLPEQPLALPMPADHGLGLHQEEVGLPIFAEPLQEGPEDPVLRPEPGSLDARPEDCKLLPKGCSGVSAARPRTQPRRMKKMARSTDIHASLGCWI